MKQVAYLTMFFLPAGLAAVRLHFSYLPFIAAHQTLHQSIFGMNVHEINGGRGSLHTFFAVAIPLTLVTVWAIGAVQYRPTSEKENEQAGGTADTRLLYGRRPGQRTYFWRRVGWPIVVVRNLVEESVRKFSRNTSVTKEG